MFLCEKGPCEQNKSRVNETQKSMLTLNVPVPDKVKKLS